MRLGGVILCGGRSTRMGQAKALLPFGSSTMLECVVERLSEVTREIAVVAARDQELPPLPSDCKVVRDEQPDRGPLEGLRMGLETLRDHCELAFITACDTPLLVPGVVTQLASHLGTANAIVPSHEGRMHPLTAIYRTSLADLVEQQLRRNERRLIDFVHSAEARILDAEEFRIADPLLNSLRNLNTLDEYDAARKNTNK